MTVTDARPQRVFSRIVPQITTSKFFSRVICTPKPAVLQQNGSRLTGTSARVNRIAKSRLHAMYVQVHVRVGRGSSNEARI
jgi:hypothetical protein